MAYLEKETDRIAYLKGMVRLAKANGEVTKNETDYIEVAAAGMGLSKKEISNLNAMWTIEAKEPLSFTDKGNAAFFMQEALQLCLVDGNYDEYEQREIQAIAKEVGISKDSIESIEKWVEEGIRWKKHGEALVEQIANNA